MKNLLYLGYPKTGSTFLRKWFDHHPQLHYRDQGFGGFDSTASIVSMPWYRPDFQPKYLVTGDIEFSFWSGPIDILDFQLVPYDVKKHQTKTCAILKSLLPNSKVLIITRGFESIVQSGYSQYNRLGGKMSFKNFIDKNQTQILEFYDYNYLVNLYSKAFGFQNLIVLPFELLAKDPVAFIHCIESKLSIETVEFDSKKVNHSISLQQMYWNSRLSQNVSFMSKVLPFRWRELFFRWYQGKLLEGSWSFITMICSRISPSKKMDLGWNPSVLKQFTGKANVLHSLPEFKEFSSQYLFSE